MAAPYQRFQGGSLWPHFDLKLPYPPPFTFAGTPAESAECFVSSVLLQLQLHAFSNPSGGAANATDKRAVIFASSLLRGAAHAWFVELVRHNMHEYLVRENERRASSKTRQEPLQAESRLAFNWMIYPFIIHDLHKLEWFLTALQDRFPDTPALVAAPVPCGVEAEAEAGTLPEYHS